MPFRETAPYGWGGRGKLIVMCGRFASTTKPEDLVEIFGVEQWDPTETLAPSWNVAPTDPAFVVLERTPKACRRRSASCGCCAGAWCRPGRSPRTPRSR